MKSETTTPCGKCNGLGEIHAFAHNAGGRCFQCHGTGRIEQSREDAARVATDRRAYVIKRLAWFIDAVKISGAKWLDKGDGSSREEVAELIASADKNVADRARAAFAKMGASF